MTTLKKWLRDSFVITPGANDWPGGFRLALAFLLPMAVGLAVGHTLTGLFIGIGAFMVANADLGESYVQRLRLMIPSTVAVPAMTAAGMAVGLSTLVSVLVGAIVLFLGGLCAALGREGAMFGTFASFAFVIGIGLAPAGLSIADVALPLFVGGVYGMALSAIAVLTLGHAPDEEPEPWRTLPSRARSATDAVLVRHAIALAIAGCIGLIIVPFTSQSNGAWLVTGALIVLKPGYEDTARTAATRAVGTVLGAALAGSIAALTGNAWVLLAAAFGFTWLAEAFVRRSFGVFVVLITPLSILLTNVLVPGDWSVAFLRTADVAVGSLIAIVVAFALRPRHAPGPTMATELPEPTT